MYLKLLIMAASKGGKLAVKALLSYLKRRPAVFKAKANKLIVAITNKAKESPTLAKKVASWGNGFQAQLRKGDVDAWMKLLLTAEGIGIVVDVFSDDSESDGESLKADLELMANDKSQPANQVMANTLTSLLANSVSGNDPLFGDINGDGRVSDDERTAINTSFSIEDVKQLKIDGALLTSFFGSSERALKIIAILAKGDVYVNAALIAEQEL